MTTRMAPQERAARREARSREARVIRLVAEEIHWQDHGDYPGPMCAEHMARAERLVGIVRRAQELDDHLMKEGR
jgi:hypothetical protein